MTNCPHGKDMTLRCVLCDAELRSEIDALKQELRELQDYMSALTEANEVMGRLERNVLPDNTIVLPDNTTKENA